MCLFIDPDYFKHLVHLPLYIQMPLDDIRQVDVFYALLIDGTEARDVYAVLQRHGSREHLVQAMGTLSVVERGKIEQDLPDDSSQDEILLTPPVHEPSGHYMPTRRPFLGRWC